MAETLARPFVAKGARVFVDDENSADARMSRPEGLKPKLELKNRLFANALSEVFGTFILLLIGLSIVAQLVLKKGEMNTWIQVNVGWGFAVTFAALLVSKTSGGHLNPAVSALFYSFGTIDLKTFIVYVLAQTVGAFLGAALTYVLYFDLIESFDGGERAILGATGTAGIFTTFAPDFLSARGAFIDQVIGTGLLCMFVTAIIDPRNKIPAHLHTLMFGLVLMMIGCGFGANLGYPINPARDLGPRLFAACIYGPGVFAAPYAGYWIIPVVAPIVGALVFGWSYYAFVGFHIRDETHKQYDEVPNKELPLHD